MMRHLRDAFEFDIRIRIEDDRVSAEGAVVNAKVRRREMEFAWHLARTPGV